MADHVEEEAAKSPPSTGGTGSQQRPTGPAAQGPSDAAQRVENPSPQDTDLPPMSRDRGSSVSSNPEAAQIRSLLQARKRSSEGQQGESPSSGSSEGTPAKRPSFGSSQKTPSPGVPITSLPGVPLVPPSFPAEIGALGLHRRVQQQSPSQVAPPPASGHWADFQSATIPEGQTEQLATIYERSSGSGESDETKPSSGSDDDQSQKKRMVDERVIRDRRSGGRLSGGPSTSGSSVPTSDRPETGDRHSTDPPQESPGPRQGGPGPNADPHGLGDLNAPARVASPKPTFEQLDGHPGFDADSKKSVKKRPIEETTPNIDHGRKRRSVAPILATAEDTETTSETSPSSIPRAEIEKEQ